MELLDLLARDAYVARVKAALERRLAGPNLTAAQRHRLTELVEWTMPAMVAEYWQGGRNLNIQHLLIGVPSVSPGGTSHFDRIDDRTAHCASGVNLSPGDYPVGVAIPHPSRQGAAFHLINLPTPRLRMAYEYRSQGHEAERFEALQQRTLAWFLKRDTPLDQAELAMLGQFDPRRLSRFASTYFMAVDDAPLDQPENSPPSPSRPSRHAMLCMMLATRGTQEAAPGLIRAAAAGRFLPPSAQVPYRFEWVAALAIAGRDPWPRVDAWLAGLVQRDEGLIVGRSQPPQLGATAAALLLKRHDQPPAEFDLEPDAEVFFNQFGVVGYRFASPQAKSKLLAWWADEAADAPHGKAKPSPKP